MRKMLMRIALFSLSFVAIGVTNTRFQAAKQYTLTYKIAEGKTFTAEVIRKHRNHRNIMGNDMLTNSEDRMAYGFTVKSGGDDGMILELEYTTRTHETDDSQIITGPDFSDLIGEKVEMLLSPTGELSAFAGFDELPEIAIPDQGMSLGELHYTNELRGLFPRLPETPVAPGDSWSDVATYDEPFGDGTIPVTIHYNYTLVEETQIDGCDCLKIDGEYTIDFEGPITAGGLDLTLDLDGTGIEIFYFAWKKGMFFSSESRSTTKGSADNKDMGFSAQMDHQIELITTVSVD